MAHYLIGVESMPEYFEKFLAYVRSFKYSKEKGKIVRPTIREVKFYEVIVDENFEKEFINHIGRMNYCNRLKFDKILSLIHRFTPIKKVEVMHPDNYPKPEGFFEDWWAKIYIAGKLADEKNEKGEDLM